MKLYSYLTRWYQENKRDLPWRHTTDPYKIWLSEIILQQTRVQQGLPYYEAFLSAFPTVTHLANASEQEVLRLWQGLGYYSRARNLHATSKIIAEDKKGVFPATYLEILDLKGIGPYTAAAISSFAYNLPHAVVDGNVQRVVSRLFNINTPVDSPAGQKEIEIGLSSIFDSNNPALFNQAIMEFGALLCTPKQPDCQNCPLKTKCLGYANKRVEYLPIKAGKTKVVSIEFNYFVFLYNEKIYIEQRTEGIWKNLYQFPLIEDKIDGVDIFRKLENIVEFIPPNSEINLAFERVHLLSHRKINAHFYTINCSQPPIFLKSNIFETELNKLESIYPTPMLIQQFLKHYKSND